MGKKSKAIKHSQCLRCTFLGTYCDGPNYLGMTYLEWVEWCAERKKILKLTNAEIADLAAIGKSTVDNILSGRSEDGRMSTVQAITKALVSGCWGKTACHYAAQAFGAESVEDVVSSLQTELNDAEERLKTAEEKTADLESLQAEVKEHRQYVMEAVIRTEQEAQKKIDFLKNTIAYKDKVIKVLAIALGAVGFILIALLIIDAIIPNLGWLMH